MKISGYAIRIGLLIALPLAIAACGGSSGDGGSTGQLKLSVKDAPVDSAEHVYVTFTGVELKADDDEAEAEVFEINPPQRVDLLALQGLQNQLLVDAPAVLAGEYQQLRLIVDAPAPSCQNPSAPFASSIVIDGTEFPLVVPSGAQTGLKIGPITVAAGGVTAYTLDFDLRKSIAERGNTGCYNLRPVIRIIDEAEVGSLSGRIDASLLQQSACTADVTSGSGAAVYLYQGSGITPDDYDDLEPEALTTALLQPVNDGTGDFEYELGFLLAGDYTVALSCQAGDDDPQVDDDLLFSAPASISIAADQASTVDFSAQAAQAAAAP